MRVNYKGRPVNEDKEEQSELLTLLSLSEKACF